MIDGERVVVERHTKIGEDPGGGPIYEWASETVDDVLVAPGGLADVIDSIRPEGVEVKFGLHFPKGYPETLRGARISVRDGEFFDVVGDPRHYTESNTPGRWSMPVEIGVVNG